MAVLWVTNAADSGDGSLRWAINKANDASGADIIEFAEDLADKTITLTSGELHITDDLTINGLGADKLTITGNNSSGIFLVDDEDPDTTITVSISALSLENGQAHGGAIFNQENITVEGCSLVNNAAPGGLGGGIYNAEGTLTVTNSTLANNRADEGGGGIYNGDYGTLTVTYSATSTQRASALNNATSIRIVGSGRRSYTQGNFQHWEPVALRWDGVSSVTDLRTVTDGSPALYAAYDINDAGWITATTNVGGQLTLPVLLIPKP